MADLNIISCIISAVSATAACVSTIVACKSLKKTGEIIVESSEARKKSEEISTVMMVLEIESQMNERKSAWDLSSKNIREAEEESVSKEKILIFADYHETTQENYFNALDRLCFCISKGYLEEKNWKVEYRNLLSDTIRDCEAKFGESTPYRHIVDLNRKWQRE